MKKRMLFSLLAAVLLVLSLSPAASAETIASGTCGEGISWSLEGYTLTISGSGEITEAPWEEHKDHIEQVVLIGGVTKICNKAFYKYDRLETVDFGDALVEIGESAFYGCEDIDFIHLPKTFRTFGAACFRDCTSLQYVYCDGGMPRFNDSCLWTGNYISVFYRGDNAWPADAVSTLVHNFGGRLGVMMGNFENSDVIPEEAKAAETEATEAVTEATEAPTEPTVAVIATEETVPVTQAPIETTVPVTEAPTEAPTVPETEAPTETPVTQATELVLEFEGDGETETVDDVAEVIENNGWMGMVLIAGVLTFLIIGTLTFRILSRKGGRYRR